MSGVTRNILGSWAAHFKLKKNKQTSLTTPSSYFNKTTFVSFTHTCCRSVCGFWSAVTVSVESGIQFRVDLIHHYSVCADGHIKPRTTPEEERKVWGGFQDKALLFFMMTCGSYGSSRHYMSEKWHCNLRHFWNYNCTSAYKCFLNVEKQQCCCWVLHIYIYMYIYTIYIYIEGSNHWLASSRENI